MRPADSQTSHEKLNAGTDSLRPRFEMGTFRFGPESEPATDFQLARMASNCAGQLGQLLEVLRFDASGPVELFRQ